MAKQKKDPITEQDLKEFVANDSDFAFEMQVLNRLRDLHFECWHSGTYQDPVSDKDSPVRHSRDETTRFAEARTSDRMQESPRQSSTPSERSS